MSGELPRRFGPYVLIAPLARTPRSQVYLARSTGEARLSAAPVVVKIHLPALEDGALERVRRRALIASIHAPRIHEIGRGETGSFVVMEHVPGWTLAQALEAEPGRWPVASAARLAAGLARALGKLGALADPDRVHGRIRPERVIIGADGRTRLLGLDRPPEIELGYAPPEQLMEAALDPRADLYAVAAILWRLLTGTPWIAPGSAAAMRQTTLDAEPIPVRSLAPEVPPRLDALIQTTLAPDPAARFATADDFREALLALVPEAEQPEPDVSDRVGETLWSERESTRTILARAAESMMPYLRPGESFVGWDRPALVEDTAANAARHTPVGAQRRFAATVIRRPDEPGTPRTDEGPAPPIPYAHTPEALPVADESTAPGAPVPKLRAPTFPGTWSAIEGPGRHPSPARVGPATEALLENARVVMPTAADVTRGARPAGTEPMVQGPTQPLPGGGDTQPLLGAPTHPSAPPSRAAVDAPYDDTHPLSAPLDLPASASPPGARVIGSWAPGAPAPASRAAMPTLTTAEPAARRTPPAPARGPSTPPRTAARAAPRRRWRPWPLLLGASGAVILIVNVVAALRTPPSEPLPMRPAGTTVVETPPAVVGAVAAPVTTASVAEATGPAQNALEEETTPRIDLESPAPVATPRAPRPSPSRAPLVAPASTPPPPEPPPAADAVVARIAELLGRARSTRARAVSGPATAELDRIIGALVLEASAPDAAGVERRLGALEATLRTLEQPR